MSNLLKSKTFKVGGLVIAIAMMLSAVAVSTASAQTTTVSAPAFTYSGLMKVGMSGPGISTLQAALNSVNAGGTVVVDGKFGPATLAAVKMFQMSHGLVADGAVGPMTGAALAAATYGVITVPNGGPFPAGCASHNGYSTTTGQSCAGTTSGSFPAGCTSSLGYSPTTGMSCSGSSSTGGSLSGGETSINGITVNDADDDSLEESANKAPVADIQFDVDDADAQLIRADVVFQAADGNSSGGEVKPWRVFDKVYLMDGSTVLASADASDDDNWDDAADVITGGNNQASRIRFSNINKIYKEGSNNNDIWVAVDVASGVDGSDTGDEDWTVGVDTDGLRFTDSAGVDTFETTSDTADFSIEQAGSSSGFTVTKATTSPDASTREVKSNSSTTETVAVFKVKTDEDGGDVKIDNFPITLFLDNSGTGDNLDEVVDDVILEVDGNTYSSDGTVGTADTQTFEFTDLDDDDVIVEAGDTMNVTVKVKFKSQGTSPLAYNNGTTILASANVDGGDVEDADSGDNVNDVNGTADAETITLAGNGISVDVNSATTTINPNGEDGFNDGATFTFNIDVTAFGDDDVYINKDVADIVSTDDANDVDTVYTVEKSGGASLTGLSGTITTSSSADPITGDDTAYGAKYNGEFFYKIASGDTETFTITISGTNATDTKQVQAYLSDIEFTTDEVTSATAKNGTTFSIQHYTANLAEDSQTGFKTIQ